jgi:RNA polymerase sigma-70 factor (ECF subfamily)
VIARSASLSQVPGAIAGGRCLAAWGHAEQDLVARLRRHEEAAFERLVASHHMQMTRLAMNYVHDFAAAEDVAQETWVAVIEGISDFQGRSSLKTWVYAILVNLAISRARRDSRVLVFASWEGEGPGTVLGARRETRRSRLGLREPVAPWGASPQLDSTPEGLRVQRETLTRVVAAIAELPPSQRTVIYLRDIRGLSSQEACERLSIADTAQRVRLHRARVRVRDAAQGDEC